MIMHFRYLSVISEVLSKIFISMASLCFIKQFFIKEQIKMGQLASTLSRIMREMLSFWLSLQLHIHSLIMNQCENKPAVILESGQMVIYQVIKLVYDFRTAHLKNEYTGTEDLSRFKLIPFNDEVKAALGEAAPEDIGLVQQLKDLRDRSGSQRTGENDQYLTESGYILLEKIFFRQLRSFGGEAYKTTGSPSSKKYHIIQVSLIRYWLALSCLNTYFFEGVYCLLEKSQSILDCYRPYALQKYF